MGVPWVKNALTMSLSIRSRGVFRLTIRRESKVRVLEKSKFRSNSERPMYGTGAVDTRIFFRFQGRVEKICLV